MSLPLLRKLTNVDYLNSDSYRFAIGLYKDYSAERRTAYLGLISKQD
jgi:hypothetical protein